MPVNVQIMCIYIYILLNEGLGFGGLGLFLPQSQGFPGFPQVVPFNE